MAVETLDDLTEEKLRKLYWEEELSGCEIAELYDAKSGQIYYRMEKWDIKKRNISKSKEIDWEEGKYESREENGNPGYTHDEQTKKHLSEANSGEKNYWYGRELDEEHRRKIRKSKTERLRNEDIQPQYNKRACEVFDKLNEMLDWNIQHAENGGEKYVDCGFWVDGYEPNLNLVIEYDESHHFRVNELREKDVKREQKIRSELDCKFVRIRESGKAYRGSNEMTEQINNVING